MNEITNALRIANTAVKTVKAIDVAKKVIIASAAVSCCLFAVKFWRK